MTERLKNLDGLRGLAISLVVLFHAFSRWPDYIDIVSIYGEFWVFKYGWLGVQLFFLISGYVIFMSLDRQNKFQGFIWARLLRLWPGMLIASALIFLSAGIFSSRPAGDPDLLDLVPGLIFTQPDWISKIIPGVNSLEGAFWSLYVEFKFYIFFGLLYFFLGRKLSLFGLIGISFAFFVVKVLIHFSLIGEFLLAPFTLLGADNYIWFSLGAFSYYVRESAKIKLNVFLYVCIACIAAVTRFGLKPELIAGLLVSTIFWFSVNGAVLNSIVASKPLLFMGFISYPLYLIHENAMVSMIVDSQDAYSIGFLSPFPPIILLCIVAWFIAKYAEPRVRLLISKLV